ncbi:MAG: hypothetical protein LQ350_002155 [Teloschistes chrysophthalmus]|nr:MAG: hypothetical protein LQ350_002155 [Niorma chrysophthalma]
MRRGSAVLLTILPLLSPACALPTTYFGNEASIPHANIERAAIPEPAVTLDIPGSNSRASGQGTELSDSIPNIASEGPEHWLPKLRRRQISGAGAITGVAGNSHITLDVAGSSQPATGGHRDAFIPNIASEGSDHWLVPENVKREAEAAPEAEAEANPAITLDLDYVPPAVSFGNQNLGAPKRRELNL